MVPDVFMTAQFLQKQEVYEALLSIYLYYIKQMLHNLQYIFSISNKAASAKPLELNLKVQLYS